jgi:acetate---CoA ligase (ADP-forming)
VDALARCRIPLARLGADTQRELAGVLPQWAPRHEGLNPVTLDTPGGLQDDPMLLVRCATVASRDPAVGALAIVGLFGGYSTHRDVELEAAARLIDLRRSGMPMLVASSFDGIDDEVTSELRRGGIAVYSSSDQLVSALATRMRRSPAPLSVPPLPLEAPGKEGEAVLPIGAARRLLSEAGVPCAAIRTVEPGGDLDGACEGLRTPLCVKLELPGLTHKSDVHGVRLDLDRRGVGDAAAELWSRYPEASLTVMTCFPKGFELLVGITWDELFGPVVVVGRGGIWAEVERDTTVILPPASRDELLRALWSLRCAPMIAGGRGQPPLDVEALVDLLESVCELAVRSDHLSVDLNPVILYEQGLAVVDFTVTALGGRGQAEGQGAC